jgi:hypothetical protein
MRRRDAFRQRPPAGELHTQAQAVLARMFEGASLHLVFDRRLGPTWQLSPSGKVVPAEVAKTVIANPDVASANDGLFGNEEGPAQTWCWTGAERGTP